jgi:hypothetical protein
MFLIGTTRKSPRVLGRAWVSASAGKYAGLVELVRRRNRRAADCGPPQYKVEKWTRDGARVERMLYAGSDRDKAREVFAAAIYHRPRIRLAIRQRMRVLNEWPKAVP